MSFSFSIVSDSVHNMFVLLWDSHFPPRGRPRPVHSPRGRKGMGNSISTLWRYVLIIPIITTVPVISALIAIGVTESWEIYARLRVDSCCFGKVQS